MISPKKMYQKKYLQEVFLSSLKAADPYMAVTRHEEKISSAFMQGDYQKCIVLGFGKAACHMAKAVEDSCGDIVNTGIAITKYSHCTLTHRPQKMRVFEAGHPLPDAHGVHGTNEAISLLQGTDENTFVVCLISGGASALLPLPAKGLLLSDKQAVSETLLACGATIHEINAVRKHISAIKGGLLARAFFPAESVTLILSDVVGDDLDVIGSGPTVADGSTFADCLEVFQKYDLKKKLPLPVE